MDPVTIVGRRFHSGGSPWFSTTHFLWNTPSVFSHVYWSENITSGQKSGILNTIAAQGFNAMDIYTLNEGDYGSRRVTPFSNGAFSGGFDNAKLASWRADLINIINMGIRPFLWTRADDSPAINGMSQALYETYLARMVQEFDDLPIMWVLGLEVDEYWSLATSNARGTYLQSIATQPVGIHQLVGQTNFMTPSWVQFGMYQGTHPNNNPTWQQHFDAVLSAKTAIGNKPLVWSEYQQNGSNSSLTFQARQFGLAGSFAGAAGYGNGGPQGLGAFMESLPANMTSSRTGNIITMTGSGVTARADMTTLAFEIVPPPAADRTSNVFAVNWTRPAPPAPAGYTPFPFNTAGTMSQNNAGLTQRPAYNAANPFNARFIDPTSGIEMCRLTGNRGDNVLLRGQVNSGLRWPASCRPDNGPAVDKTFNCDSSILILDQSRSASGDPSPAARRIMIDLTGERTGRRFSIIRALTGSGGSDFASPNSVRWAWDHVNPNRIISWGSDGSIHEHWPVPDTPGHTLDQRTQIHGPVGMGLSQFNAYAGHGGALSHLTGGNQYWVLPCRRNSDNVYGGIRRNVVTGALNSFIPNVYPMSRYPSDGGFSAGQAQGTSMIDGRYTKFSAASDVAIRNVLTGQITVPDANVIGNGTISHTDFVVYNGQDYMIGPMGNGVYMLNCATGQGHRIATFNTGNPNHASGRGYLDLAQIRGPTAGSGQTASGGQRYILLAKTTRAERGLRFIRLATNGSVAYRWIGHHRGTHEGGIYSNNEAEVHAHMSPNGRYVVFPSNWRDPGVVTDYFVHAYIAIIPDAFYSPNNNGS